MTRVSTMLALSALALCCGCATTFQAYPGPERPATETATIEGTGHYQIYLILNFIRTTKIASIDGMQRGNRWIGKATVLPGDHVVKACYHVIRGSAVEYSPPVVIPFTAAAGRRYRVDGRKVHLAADYWDTCIWIEDVDTGALVAGSKDPLVKP